MSELSVGSLKGLAANSFVIDIAAGSTLNVPPPAILQVVQGVKTDVFTAAGVAGTKYAVTGLTASITPGSATSKILIAVNVAQGNQFGGALFITGGVSIPIGDAAGSRQRAQGATTSAGGNYHPALGGFITMDTPNTTSTLNYGVEITSGWTDTRAIYVNRGGADTDATYTYRAPSTITLMEIAG